MSAWLFENFPKYQGVFDTSFYWHKLFFTQGIIDPSCYWPKLLMTKLLLTTMLLISCFDLEALGNIDWSTYLGEKWLKCMILRHFLSKKVRKSRNEKKTYAISNFEIKWRLFSSSRSPHCLHMTKIDVSPYQKNFLQDVLSRHPATMH